MACFNLTNETDLLNNKIKEIQQYIINLKDEKNYSNRIKINLYTDYYFAKDESSDKKGSMPSLEIGFKIKIKTHEGCYIELPKIVVNSNEGKNEYTTMSLMHRLNHYNTMIYIVNSIKEYLSDKNFIVEIIDIPEEDKKLIPKGNSLKIYVNQIRS